MTTPPTRLTPGEQLRRIGNLVNLATPTGLLVARIGRCRVRPGPRGLVLADRYRPRFPVAGAFTVGNVLITGQDDWSVFAEANPRTFAHEERHTWQWLALGPLFLPAYSVALTWSWLRTGNTGAANVFEQLADLADGGYPELPRRSLASGLRAATSSALAGLTSSRRSVRPT